MYIRSILWIQAMFLYNQSSAGRQGKARREKVGHRDVLRLILLNTFDKSGIQKKIILKPFPVRFRTTDKRNYRREFTQKMYMRFNDKHQIIT